MTKTFMTIGMAHHSDLDGVFFTISSLRLCEPEVMDRVEFLVIDNSPDSPHGKSVREFLAWVPNARYVASPETVGTAAPRDRIFREAKGDAVLALDCHVLLRYGSLKRLLDYYDANPETKDLLSGPMLYDNHEEMATHFSDEWRGEMWGTWGTDPRGLDVDGVPFEIGAMGLGLFSCRKDAWLGFNPDFRGFGGEEWYIHEKFRRAGAKCLCLPWLRWVHRFSRPNGVKYPLTRWHKVRNYVIGHRELGRDLSPIYDHFVRTGLFSQQEWEAVLAGALEPPPGVNEGCGACGTKPQPKADTNLDELFAWVRSTPRDLDKHADKIREFAAGADRITAFVKRREWNVILGAARPSSLVVYQLEDDPLLKSVHAAWNAEKTDSPGHYTTHTGHGADSLQVEPIAETDLLVIDTIHHADRLIAELNRHAGAVTKRILLRGTEAFGEHAEGGGPGLLPAIRRWVREHPEWSSIYHSREQYGITVLSKDPADKPKLPTNWRQGWNFLKSQTKHILNGGTYLPLPMAEARLAECSMCDQRVGENCAKCGCFLWRIADDAPVKAGEPGKVWYPTEACPLGRWDARPSDGVNVSGEEMKKMLAPLAEVKA